MSEQSLAKIKNIRKSRIEKFVQLITEKFAQTKTAESNRRFLRVFLSSFKQKFGYLQSAISTSPIGYALQEWIYPNISSAWRRSTPLGINTLPETSLTLQSEHSPLRQHTLTLTPARSSAHKMDSLHFASITLSPTLSLKTSVPLNS